MNNYENIRLDKSMYKSERGFMGALEELDPSAQYQGTRLAGLDAFERQLSRFDIKVKGPDSSAISKFFSTGAAALFPEYVSRAVAAGAKDSGVIEEIIASKTEVNSLDYRSITTGLDDGDLSDHRQRRRVPVLPRAPPTPGRLRRAAAARRTAPRRARGSARRPGRGDSGCRSGW